MGEVDLIDAAVATCRVKFKGKKWWWAHYTNTLAVIMGAAWRIFCVTNQDEDQSLLYFLRSVVQSYLHVGKISAAPTPHYWKTKKKVDDNICLTGRGHWINTIESQFGCQFPSCKSKVRAVCETCDVALCIKDAHFKLYHTIK